MLKITHYVLFLLLLFINNSFTLETSQETINNSTLQKDDRAPRPEAPGSQDGTPVGSLLGCNIEPLNELLKKINAFLINCCSTLQADFNGTFTVLANQTACASSFLKVPTIINTPGTYCLANDVIGTFTINADDVIFDLNGHTISSSDVGIFINAGTNRTIKNGRIDAMAVAGIMASNCDTITIQDILCTNCGTEFGINQGALLITNANSNIRIDSLVTNTCANGILLSGDTNQPIEGCSITNIMLNNCFAAGLNVSNVQDLVVSNGIILGESSTAIFCSSITRLQINNFTVGPTNGLGIVLFSCTDITAQNIDVNNVFSTGYNILVASNLSMQNCIASNIIETQDRNVGFVINQVNNAYFDSCLVQNIITNTLSHGFIIENSLDIIFKDCISESIKATDDALGFLVEGSSNITFQNCGAVAIESTQSIAYGFQVETDCNHVILDHCITSSCGSFAGAGFLLEGTDSSLTDCLATACSGLAGYFIQTGTTSLQYCQANYNTGDGFLYQSGASLTGNCSAYNNTGSGFNVTGGSHIGYHNASFANIVNQFVGFGAINSIFDQVNPTVSGPNGPFAGSNLTL